MKGHKSVYIRDVHPSHRLSFQAFPLVGVDSFNQSQSLLGRHGFDSIYPCRSLALVVLRHPTDGEARRRPGAHQESLESMDCSGIATLRGSVDTGLELEDLPLESLPGQVSPFIR